MHFLSFFSVSLTTLTPARAQQTMPGAPLPPATGPPLPGAARSPRRGEAKDIRRDQTWLPGNGFVFLKSGKRTFKEWSFHEESDFLSECRFGNALGKKKCKVQSPKSTISVVSELGYC